METAKLKFSIAEDYWIHKLLSAQSQPIFGREHTKPVSFGIYSSSIPEKMALELTLMAKDNVASKFLLLLTAWNILLHKYSGSRDVLVATTAFKINEASASTDENALLYFRTSLEVQHSARSLIKEALEQLNAANRYGQFDHSEFLRRMEAHLPGAATVLNRFGLIYESFNRKNMLLDELGLLLEIKQEQQRYTIQFRYADTVYREQEIAQLAGHYLNILGTILDDIDKPLASIPMLTPAEQQEVITAFNQPATAYPAKTIAALFAEQAILTPEATALTFNEQELSYAALNKSANRLAHYLQQEHQVMPGQMVGLMTGRGISMIVGIMGILKAGAAYVPLDPEYPATRKQHMLSDAGVTILLTTSDYMFDVLSYYKGNLVAMDLQAPDIDQCQEHDPAPTGTPESLAYLMYTSGSTGLPKGVAVMQKNVVRLVKETNYVAVTHTDSVLQLSNFAFDGSVFDIFGALLNGACLHLPERETLYTMEALSAFIRKRRPNITFITTSLFNSLVDLAPDCIGFFDKILVGGEEVSLHHVETALQYQRRPGAVVNIYGPTEGTTFSAYYEVKAMTPGMHYLPIGYPIANTEVFVLDEAGNLLPPGVEGGIFIAGDGLAREYWGQPALTQQKFMQGIGLLADRRLYDTGDLGRWETGLGLVFRGRRDRQVKLRGHRIELGEIEQALLKYEGISQVYITMKQDKIGEKYLACYYTATQQLQAELLRNWLLQGLPDHMAPAVFIALKELPLNANGKIDHNKLPEPDLDNTGNAEKYAAPRTDLEKTLVAIWQEITGRNHIGITDNFFLIGGDSLKAIRIANKIQKDLGEIIHVAALFETPTIEALAASIEQYRVAPVEKVATGMLRQFDSLIRPLPPQSRLYPRNPPALFMLSSPRAGSTLLRSLLAGHPALFSPPELELLNFNTLQERKEEFSGRFSFYREGVVRAFMDIRKCSAEEALALMDAYEEQNLTSQQMYLELQSAIGNRLLVDKSPFYTLDIEVLRRAEIYFEDPLYLYLYRNPYGTIASFEEAKIDQIFRHQHSFRARELAELVWIASNRNTRMFLQEIPAHRKHFVSYEDLVSDPERTIRGICGFLRIDYFDQLTDLYGNPTQRMMDGVFPESKTLGDIKILNHSKIEQEQASRWKKKYREDFLGDDAKKLAQEMGYQDDFSPADHIPVLPSAPYYDVSQSQKRLWIISQDDVASIAYNSPQSCAFEGDLDPVVFAEVYRALIERHEILRTVFEVVNGELKQKVLSADLPRFELQFKDLSHDVDGEMIVANAAETAAHALFDLAAGPLIKGSLFKTGNGHFVFLCTMHHIICDAWSLTNIFREIRQIYKAFRNGQPNPLSPLRIQFKEFAAWQNAMLNRDGVNEHREYWHAKLAGELPVLDFPTEFARTPEKKYNGKYFSHELDTDTSGQFRNLAREGQSSLFITFLALVKVLVYRYTGQQDFILGTSVTGRNHPELENQVGLYLNTLLFRDTITGDDNFEQVLEKVRQTVTAAYTHQMYPFNRLVDELKVARDPSRHPVIDIMVDQHKHDHQEQEEDGEDLKVEGYTREAYFNKMDLVFNIVETEGPLVLGLGYNTDLFSEQYAQRICMHLERLLQGIIAAPDRSIKDLDLLSSSEREYILHELNPQHEESEDKRSIKEQFEWHAERAPEAVCIREGLRVYSYGEVDALANRLAHYLEAECGLLAGDRVGVLQDRSAWLVISMLAVMKAGGVYVPADTAYPGNRKGFIFSDADVRVVLTVSDQLFSLSEYYVGKVFVVDSQADELQKYSSARLSTVLTSASPAYIIYTSGSTGQPKGVLVSNGALQNLCSWHCHAFGVDAGSRATLYAGVGFDASLWEVWPYLLSGASLYPFTEADRLDLGQIRFVLEGEKITHCFLPTPVCEQLGHIDCAGLILLTGGDRLQEVPGGNVRIVNNYGPTEGTVVSTSVFLEGAMKGAVPIGRPIRNTEAYVLDADGGLVPVGITGELYISGAHLSSGYINNIWLTQSRFVPHLYRSGELMYATGDLCRWGTDGQLYFMGRKDNQVKVRGYRIELGEIEQHLLSYEGITQAYVLLREGSGGEGVLIAYYTGSGDLSRQLLRSYLQGRLPSYMVPPYYVHLDEVPLTANGKVDRSAFELPEEFELRGSGEEKAGARTHEEAVLLEIWQELLGHDHIGIRDNFFEIGGHSLKAVQMITRIYEKLQVTVKMNTVFMYPTIGQLAEELVHYEKKDFEHIQPLPYQDHYAISHAQKRLWILSQAEEKHVAHNMSEAYDLRGALNSYAFRKAMLSMIERHESLRTTIRLFEGEPRQVIHEASTMDNVFCYLDMRNSMEGEASLQARIEEEARFVFDLGQGPLIRALLIRLEEEHYVFVFTLHHIITDGWSMGIIMRELLHYYNAYNKGLAHELEPLRIQYKDFTAWHQQQLTAGVVDPLRAYWLNKLQSPLPVLAFPKDLDGSSGRTDEGQKHYRRLGVDLSRWLKQQALEQEASLFIMLVSMVKALLYKYTGQEDLVIGSPVAGRDHVDLEDQIGFYVNTLALRTQFNGAAGFPQLLGNVRKTVLEAYEHQTYPFDMLINDLQLKYDGRQSSLFDVLVILQNMQMRAGADTAPEGIRVSKYETGVTFSKFDLLFNFVEDEEDLVMTIVYNVHLFRPETIERLADNYCHIAQWIMENYTVPLAEIMLLTSEEENREMDDFLGSMKNL